MRPLDFGTSGPMPPAEVRPPRNFTFPDSYTPDQGLGGPERRSRAGPLSVSRGRQPSPPPTGKSKIRPAQARLAAAILALAVASLAYRWLGFHHLEQTAARFLGRPALLASALTLPIASAGRY